MFVESLRPCRKHAMAVATAIALASLLSAPAFAGGRVETSGLRPVETYDQFIVQYRDGSAERANVDKARAKLTRATRSGGQALSLGHVRRLGIGADLMRANRKLGPVEARQLMHEIAADPNVEYVEVDARMYPMLSPNDTNYSQQWGFNGTYGIKAPAAWDVATGTGVVVAVIDTGSTSHSDLNANMLPGYDFVSSATNARDGNGRDSNPQDQGDWAAANECYSGSPASNSSWHGTHVAGTVAALTNNAKGVAGTAFNARVVPVRVLAKCGGSLSDIADAITWASGGTVTGVPANANPAEVINMSLGGSGTCGTTYQNAINGAVGRGTTVVVAAGNDNTNASNARPANCSNVIAVASITSSGARSSFSNYGSLIDIAAPGSSIMSTLNSGTTTPGSESYASYNGTSMATPHVAGVVALMQSAVATPKTPAQIESLLKANATAFPATPSQPIGPGILNALAAINAAKGGGGTTYSNTADYTISDNVTVESPITVSGASGNGLASTQVAVNIVHTYIGDLKVDVVAPDGSIYTVHNRAGGSADNINTTYTVNLSSEAKNGTWKLRVNDNAAGDTGYINSWSVTF